jgi:hypothetical protein
MVRDEALPPHVVLVDAEVEGRGLSLRRRR